MDSTRNNDVRKDGAMDKGEITILAIEDEDDIRKIILHNLQKDGYAVLGAADGEEGLRLAVKNRPHVIVLDLMLPGMDGMAVCRRVRANPEIQDTPILMLTARDSEEDMVSGLEAGADDYVAKPFSNRVLLARVRSLLRREGIRERVDEDEKEIAAGGIRLIPARREAIVSGRNVDLTTGEYGMLQVMMRRPGIVFTRNQLLDLVRGALHAVTDRAVDVQVVGLRRKLGAAGSKIETVRGAGYRFNPDA